MSLTRDLFRLVQNKPVQDNDLRSAALYFMDAVANAVAGRKTVPGQILCSWSKTTSGDAGREAFLLGGLIHTLETDDLHRASVVHPGCVVVPAVISLGRRVELEGQALLAATLKGFEACCRVGMAVGPKHYRVWHNTATCGPFGSATAAASLLALDEDKGVHALGNAGTQAAGFWQFLETGAMSKHLHTGRAAEAGVVAAELADSGFTGAPEILEGDKGFFAGACPDPDPEAVLRNPNSQWQLHETSIKPWPSCRHTHPVIDAAIGLREKLAGQPIGKIRIETYQAAVDVCDRPNPDSEYEAKFSLQHCASVALTDGKVGFDSFNAIQRDRSPPHRAEISIEVAEPFASNYPKAWGARIEAETLDGKCVAVERLTCKGDPETALDENEMIAKAMDLLAVGGVGKQESECLIREILAMADNGPLPELETLFEMKPSPRTKESNRLVSLKQI
jgi:2-methylcitrate dehydratase PrpD